MRSSFTFANLLLLGAATLHGQLVSEGFQFFDQGDLGNLIEADDRFGGSLAAGDFDNDGFDDLAVGLPGEDIGPVVDAGSILVIYGAYGGLNEGPRPPLSVHQDVPGVQDSAETDDGFGTALSAGDYNGDGWDELVVAVPFEDLYQGDTLWQTDAGALHVFIGGIGGIVPAADQYFTAQAFMSLPTGDLGGIELGGSLATGRRFYSGAHDDLLTGAPGRSGVAIDTGTDSGLDPPTGPALIRPEEWDLPYGRFGTAVALGKLEDGYTPGDSLVVGAPEQRQPPFGALRAGGLWIQSRACFPDTFSIYGSQEDQALGSAVALGDFFDGDEYETVLVSSPGREVGGQASAGYVQNWNVSNLVCDVGILNPETYSQGTPPLSETAEPFDRFGESLAVGDFNNDGYDDAVFGVPGENLFDGTPGAALDAGVFHVVYGAEGGLSNGVEQLWSLPALGITPLANDKFGSSFAVGDFNNDDVDDLAISAPGAAVSDGGGTLQPGSGLVLILYGSQEYLFRDGFESGTTAAWTN